MKISRAISWLFLGFMVLFILVPFLMIVLTSVKSMPEINDIAHRNLFQRLFPDRITNLGNYILVISGKSKLLSGTSFLVYIKNSIIVVVLSLTPAVFFTVTAA
jgi:ABC-type glycerol-3-phosphate transport system permease component